MTRYSVWILVAAVDDAVADAAEMNLRVSKSAASDVPHVQHGRPLVTADDGKESFSELTNAAAATSSKPTVAEKNQMLYDGVLKSLNSFTGDSTKNRLALQSSFNTQFNTLVSSIESMVGQVVREYSKIETEGKTKQNKYTNDLNNLEPSLSNAAVVSAAMTKLFEESVSEIEGKFDVRSLEDQGEWNAKQLKKQEDQMAQLIELVQKTQKFTEEYGGKAVKIGGEHERNQIKMEMNAEQMENKFEEATDKIANRFEAKQETVEEDWANMETIFEELYEKADAVYDSPDPNRGKTGLNVASEMAMETIQDVREELTDASNDYAEDASDTMEDYEDIVNELLADGADKIADHGDGFAYTNEQVERALRMALKLAKNKNSINIYALASRVMDLERAVEATQQDLFATEKSTDKKWKDLFFEMEASQQAAVRALKKGQADKEMEFNEKKREIFQYLQNLKSSASTDVHSKISDVKTGALQVVKGVAEEVGATVAAAEGTVSTAGENLEATELKAESLKAVMATQKRDEEALRAATTPIHQMHEKVSSAENTAIAGIDNIKGDTIASFNEATYKASQQINAMAESAVESIRDSTSEMAKLISSAGQNSASDLDAFVNQIFDLNAQLKGGVYQLEERVNGVADFWKGEVESLRNLGTWIANDVPELVEAMQGLSFEAQSMSKELEQPTIEGVQQGYEQAKHFIQQAGEDVNTGLRRSQSRINTQYSDTEGRLNLTEDTLARSKKHRLQKEMQVGGMLAHFQKELADEASKAGLADEQLASDLMSTLLQIENTKAQYANIFDGSSSDTESKALQLTHEFKEGTNKEVLKYKQDMLHNSAVVDMLKSAFQEELKRRTIADQQNFAGGIRNLEGHLSGEQQQLALLKNALADTRASEAADSARETFDAATDASGLLMQLLVGMNGRLGALSTNVKETMANASTQNDDELHALKDLFNKRVSKIQNGFNGKVDKFRDALAVTTSDLNQIQQEMYGRIAASQQNLSATERSFHVQAAGVSSRIAEQERAVSLQFGKDLLAVNGLHNDLEGQVEHAEQYAKTAVDQGIINEDKLIDEDVVRNKRAAVAYIDRLDTSKDSAEIAAQLDALKEKYKDELRLTTALESQSEQAAKTMGFSADEIQRAAMKQIQRQLPAVEAQDKLNAKTLEHLNDEVKTGKMEMAGHVNEEKELAFDVLSTFNGMADDRKHSMMMIEEELAHIEELKKYQGKEAMDSVTAALKEAIDNQDKINQMIYDEVQPKSQDLRKRMGQVFADLGFEMNLAAVDAMANESMAEEKSKRERLLEARQHLEATMHKVARETKSKLDDMYARTVYQIEEVKRMEHLSFAEKQMRIRDIKADARRKMKTLMTRAQATIQNEMKAKYDIGQRNDEMDTLVARARALSDGGTVGLTSEMLQSVRSNVKDKMEALYTKYVTPSSFIQSAAGVAGENDAAASPHETFERAETQLKSLASDRAAQTANWQAQLSAWL